MPYYTLTLTHTSWGSPGHNPNPVAVRRARAITVARRNNVTINSITDNPDGTITWVIQGEDKDICDMLSIWARHRNVTVSGGPDCSEI
jgi:hypothetical protein